MEIIKYTVVTRLSPEIIWDLWTSVDTWQDWDPRIESSRIFGGFEEGVEGELKPRGGPLLKIKLTLVEPKSRFVIESKVMGVSIVFSHSMEKRDGQLFLMLSIEMQGPLASFLASSLGPKIKHNVPQVMNALLKRVEEKVIT